MASRPVQVAGTIARLAVRGVWLSTMILVPLFGFWLASSLAAYKNASQWLALLVGLLLFPLVPVGWDLVFVWRRSKREPEKAILTRADRLVLRTLIVNGIFLIAMAWFARGSAIRALSVRGDWMLDGHDGPIARTMRSFLLGIADRLDSYGKQDHYGESDDAPDPSEIKPRKDAPVPTPTPTPTPRPAPDKPGEPAPAPSVPRDASGWPFPDEADPKVANMPEASQATIETVGAYLKAQFPDKKERVKAMHDFVALRLSYDEDALRRIMAGDRKNTPSQEAEAVFAARTGVCAGYAKLMVALGKSSGIEVMYITGHARASDDRLPDDIVDEEGLRNAFGGIGHAWNAVKVDDEWYLVDVTWDDPTSKGGTRKPVYANYLMTPPRMFAYDHLPEKKAWQLLESPLSPGEFARQPMVKPAIGRYGLTLVSPTRSQVSVSGEVTIVLENPYAARLSGRVKTDGSRGDRCTVSEGKRSEITCTLDRGEHEVQMFAAPARAPGETGSYTLNYIGTILVNSR